MANLVRKTFLTTYIDAAPGVTVEAVQHHVSDDWLTRKESSFREKIIDGTTSSAVARLGETVVGFCMLATDQKSGAFYIDPDYRGGFVGVNLCLALAERIDLSQPLVLTVVPNTPAERFYRKLGFKPTRRDISDEMPRLRGGQILPQVELVLTPENARRTLRRIEKLLELRVAA